MDKMRIRGGKPLHGAVTASGAKNAALPILIASLLTGDECRFRRVPGLWDVRTVLKILEHMGAHVARDPRSGEVRIRAATLAAPEAPYDLVRTMRASVVVLGPLVARFGKAKVSLPGGCAIGARPVNFHLTGLEKLGASIRIEGGYILADAKRLRGNRVPFESPSVGATENVLMAAALADGESVLENCAREPEIVDLAVALRSMGAEIEGEGTPTIRVQGKPQLRGCDHSVMADRIEAGTFLAAGFITGGEVRVDGVKPEILESVLVKLEEAGATVTRGPDHVGLRANGRPRGTNLTTLPFPGFPTDMQAQFMALMTVADGVSLVTETIFENRFMHVPELARLGAKIEIRGNTAQVIGEPRLVGAPLMATDLRASASLILGGLRSEGETVVNRIYHLDRGYERMEDKLRSLGADIERIPG